MTTFPDLIGAPLAAARETVTRAKPGRPPGVVYREYAAVAARQGSSEQPLQPSEKSPVWLCASRSGPRTRYSVQRPKVPTRCPATSTPGSATTYGTLGSGYSLPSTAARSGVRIAPGPGAVPSRLQTYFSERFQNSVSQMPVGSCTFWPR